jgi:hypothetical protein
MKKLTQFILILVTLFANQILLKAGTIIFNNMNKTTYGGYSPEIKMAQQFKVTGGNVFIHEVSLLLKNNEDAGIEMFNVSIYSDDADNVGSFVAIIYNGRVSDLDNSYSEFIINNTNSFDSNLPIELENNTKYWIAVESEYLPVTPWWAYTTDNTGDGDGFLPRAMWESLGGMNDYYNNKPYKMKITADNVLPVELISFTLQKRGQTNDLMWVTATEVNNYGFEIEKSSDKTEWLNIGFVKGHGNSNSPKEYVFSDYDTPLYNKVYYRLKQIDTDGKYQYSKIIESENLPAIFSLSQNFPNPFNPTTTIKFSLPQAEFVTIKVFDILGNEVEILANKVFEAGEHSLTWNAKNLSSGIYFYNLSSDKYNETKKMILLR